MLAGEILYDDEAHVKYREYMRKYMKNLTDEQREQKNKRSREQKRRALLDPESLQKIRATRKRSYQKHKDKRLAEVKEYAETLKSRCYDYYGRICKCCGETNPMFLTFDHINNDGAAHRKTLGQGGNKLYKWLVDNKFPPIVQVLCFNCNCGKQRNGGICPHQVERV